MTNHAIEGESAIIAAKNSRNSGLLACWVTLFLVLMASDGASGAESPDQDMARGWVAVDVGHTLAVPGATSARGTPEFAFNRALAGTLADAIVASGTRVRLVNGDGLIAGLVDRGRAAAGARVLLSVHHDSVQPHYLSTWEHAGVARAYSDRHAGFSLFVSRKNPALAASIACAAAIGSALRGAGFVPSLYHAERIKGESKPFADRANGVHYYDNLIVLKSAASPAVLFEAGVIVNRDEELLLQDDARRLRMARAIAAGIASCSAPRGSSARRRDS